MHGSAGLPFTYLEILKPVYKPVQASRYPTVAARLPAPTKSHQNCIHLIFHLIVHHEGLQVPSTQAIPYMKRSFMSIN